MTTSSESALEHLAAVLRSMPPGTAGSLAEGPRLLVLTRKRDRLELRLQLNTGLGADSLLDALVSVPTDAAQGAATASKNKLGEFTRREREYLAAMLAWSARVLSVPAPALKKRSAASPARRAVRKLVEAATDGSTQSARRFLEDQADTLDSLSATEVAHLALDFLREEDVLVELDWKDEAEFSWAAAERIERLGLGAAAQALRGFESGGSLQEQTAKASRILQAADYALTEIDDGSDSYCFVVCAAARALILVDSLLALGVTAKPVGAADAEPA